MIYNPRQTSKMGIMEALSAVAPAVREALEQAHDRLREAGIPHVLIGGLAVGVHGHAYNTKDVDLLVSREDAFTGELVVAFRPGVPILVGTVAVDYLTPENEPPAVRSLMEEALDLARSSPDDILVIPAHVLVYMKLRAGRLKDLAAVVELIKAGLEVEEAQQLLEELGDAGLLKKFRRCLEQATREDDV